MYDDPLPTVCIIIPISNLVPQAESDTSPLVDTPPSPAKSKHKKSTRKKKANDSDTDEGSPSHLGQKNAPPPLPTNQRRRTQPDFMKELAAEMAERKDKDLSEGLDTPPAIREKGTTPGGDDVATTGSALATFGEETDRKRLTDSPLRSTTSKGSLKSRMRPAPGPPSSKGGMVLSAQGNTEEVEKEKPKIPPPVSSKPQKGGIVKQGSMGLDEPDLATPAEGEESREKETQQSHVKQDLVGMESPNTTAMKKQAGGR